MSAQRAFAKERDAVLRSLDETAFDKLYRKWKLPRPREWVGSSRLGAMHKTRLQLDTFTDVEKAVSREWLKANGYTESVDSGAPCPKCGNPGFSQSDCEVCGVLTLQ